MRSRRSLCSRLAIGAITVGFLGLAAGVAGRVAPASAAAPPTPLVGLTGMGEIVRLDASTPGTVSAPVAITGLVAGERIVGFDVRPATGELIGIGIAGAEGRVYVINPSRAPPRRSGRRRSRPRCRRVARGRSTSTPASTGCASSTPVGSTCGQPDRRHACRDRHRRQRRHRERARVRPVSRRDHRHNAVRARWDGRPARVHGQHQQCTAVAELGVLNAIGGLGADAQADVAFDIAPASSAFAGTAIATLQVGGAPGLYTVDLRTGAATLQGTVATVMIDLAVLAPTPLLALTGDGTGVLRFDASSPGVVSGPIAIPGLGAGETIVGLDVRPAAGQLIGVGLRGGEGRVTASTNTGVATQIGTTPFATGSRATARGRSTST